MNLLRIVILVLCGSGVFYSCRTTTSESDLATIDLSLSQLIDLDALPERDRKRICALDILVTFYGNGESLYKVEIYDPQSDFANKNLISHMEKKQADQSQWYYEQVKLSYKNLLKTMGRVNKTCASINEPYYYKDQNDVFAKPVPFAAGSINLAAFLDGPGDGDSEILLSQWKRVKAGENYIY